LSFCLETSMTMRLFLSVLTLASLAACANVDDVRKKDPVFFGDTAKTATAYAECVAQSWRGQGENVGTNVIANGEDVYTSSSTGVVAVLRVQHYDDRTHVSMSTARPYGTQNMIEAANLCI
jgi:acyl dehydratase